MKEHNVVVACETTLERVNTPCIENETELYNNVEFIEKKKKLSRRNILSNEKSNSSKTSFRNDVATITRMSIKEEKDGDTASVNRVFPTGYTSQSHISPNSTTASDTNSIMSTLYHSQAGAGFIPNQGFIAPTQPQIVIPGYSHLPTSVAFMGPHQLPLEYYTPSIIKSSFGGVPLAWSNVAFAHAIKTMENERKANVVIPVSSPVHQIAPVTDTMQTKSSADEYKSFHDSRSKLHSSLSDGANNGVAEDSKSSKKFERRNSAPPQTPVAKVLFIYIYRIILNV